MQDAPIALLEEARKVLERYMFDGERCRDDVAEVCQKIDDLLGDPAYSTPQLSAAPRDRAAA